MKSYACLSFWGMWQAHSDLKLYATDRAIDRLIFFASASARFEVDNPKYFHRSTSFRCFVRGGLFLYCKRNVELNILDNLLWSSMHLVAAINNIPRIYGSSMFPSFCLCFFYSSDDLVQGNGDKGFKVHARKVIPLTSPTSFFA